MSIQIQARTLKILPSGAGRLSPDLSRMSEFFAWNVDRKHKKMTLRVVRDFKSQYKMERETILKPWKAGVKAQSKLIALRSVLLALGLDVEEMKGRVYDVSVKGETLEVKF